MKFLIVNMDGFNNKGCEASLKSTVNEIQKNDQNALFKVFTHNPDYDKLFLNNGAVTFQKVPFTYNMFNRFKAFSKPIAYRFVGTLGFSQTISEGLNAYNWADAVIVTGGDIFSSTYPGLFLRYLPIELAANFKKPIILMGHSIGPFGNENEYKTFIKMMKNVNLITARETVSLQYLKSMKLKNTQIKLTADPAFCLKPDMENIEELFRVYGVNTDKILVGLCPSQAITGYSGSSYGDHFKILCRTLEFLTQKLDCHVLLIPHVHHGFVNFDDRIICELLYRKLGFPKNVSLINFNHSAEEFRAIIAHLDLLITERVHAAIASLSQNVPAFVIGYSIKAKGILGDIFGYDSVENYMVSVVKLNEDRLNNCVKKLLDQKTDCSKYLSKVMPDIEKKAICNFTSIFDVLNSKSKIGDLVGNY